MSPVNPNFGDREFDAIHRAQRAHEPSMEEILASIRNIIADDPAKGAALKSPAAAADARADAARSSIPKRPPRRTATPPGCPSARTRTRRGSSGAGRKRSKPSPQPMRSSPDEEPLLSPEANEAVALSFGALSASLEVRSAELADSMVARHAAPDGQDVAGREPPGDGRAAGPGGDSEGRARAEIGPRLPSRVDFDRGDAFIARRGACACGVRSPLLRSEGRCLISGASPTASQTRNP